VSQASTPRPADIVPDPVIEAFKKDVDRTLLRENLKLTPDQRVRKLAHFMRSLEEVRAAGAAGRPKDFQAIAELEALREERDRSDGGGFTP
jgi:hypothetical protein